MSGTAANSLGESAAVTKLASTSASSQALRSSTRRNRTANPTTRKIRGYESRIWSAMERTRVLMSPMPSTARNTGVITKGCACPGRCTVRDYGFSRMRS